MATKSNSPATKKDVQEIVLQATDAILNGVDKMFSEQNSKVKSMDDKLIEIDKRLKKVENKVEFAHQDVRDIQVEISTLPSRKEFSKLKAQVGVV